jgi:hypothetical protein
LGNKEISYILGIKRVLPKVREDDEELFVVDKDIEC